MEEIWKDIPEYEGYYQASNLGRIRSLDRIVKHNLGGDKKVKGRILKQALDKGYYVVSLSKNNVRPKLPVHQLVAMTFLGHKPNGRMIVVDHIDNNQKNNRLDNLQIITCRLNNTKDRKGETSKYTGVSWIKAKGKFTSSIRINGRLISLGHFKCEETAAKYYQDALISLSKKEPIKVKRIDGVKHVLLENFLS